jgi:hypothetical protein
MKGLWGGARSRRSWSQGSETWQEDGPMAQRAGPELAAIGQRVRKRRRCLSVNAIPSKKSACVPAHARTRIRARGEAARRGLPSDNRGPERADESRGGEGALGLNQAHQVDQHVPEACGQRPCAGTPCGRPLGPSGLRVRIPQGKGTRAERDRAAPGICREARSARP